MFQTLGNISTDPRVGLLFVEIDEVVEIAGQGPLGWRFIGDSSFNSG